MLNGANWSNIMMKSIMNMERNMLIDVVHGPAWQLLLARQGWPNSAQQCTST